MLKIILLTALIAVCAITQSQGQPHMMPLIPFPPPMFPAIPAPWQQGGAWTRGNVFGSPLFPGGMPSGQSWSTGPFWGQQWSTSGQTGQFPVNGQFGQNGQWFSSGQNGLSQWPVNGQNGQWSSNGQNGQWSSNGQNGQLSSNGQNGQWSFNDQTGQWTDQSQFGPNSWAVNGQQGNTFTLTDNFGTGMTTGNSDPWGINRQFTSLRNPVSAGNQGSWNQQTGFNNGFSSGSDQTGWQSIDGSLQNGFQSGFQNINNGLPSSTGSFGTPFGLNLPPRTASGKKK